MTTERELLRRISSHSGSVIPSHFIYEIRELLAQPEQEPSVKLPESEDEAVMMNLLSDNWLRHHAPHRLNQPEQEPVDWQYRTTPNWREQWSKWESCGKNTYEDYKRVPQLHDWVYETRELYTSPPTRDEDPVAWLSLSDIQWMNIVNDPEILKLTGGRHNFEDAVNLAVKMTEAKCKANNSNSIPAREPLSDKAIWTANTEQIFEEGVRWAEQQHKIWAKW